MPLIDLRKFHINNEKEAIEFLELVESRSGEIIRHMKKQSLRIVQLNNLLDFERKKNAGQVFSGPGVPEARVSQPAAPELPVTTEEDELLKAMQVAAGQQVAPGEVGQVKNTSVSAGVDSEVGDNQFKKEEQGQPELTEPVEKPKRRLLGRVKKSDK